MLFLISDDPGNIFDMIIEPLVRIVNAAVVPQPPPPPDPPNPHF